MHRPREFAATLLAVALFAIDGSFRLWTSYINCTVRSEN